MGLLFLRVLSGLALFGALTRAMPTGAPASACQSMMPGHGVEPQNAVNTFYCNSTSMIGSLVQIILAVQILQLSAIKTRSSTRSIGVNNKRSNYRYIRLGKEPSF